MTVVGLEKPFPGAIGGNLRLDNFGARNGEMLAEPAALGLGDVAHRNEIRDAAVVNPVPDLLGAKLRLLWLQAPSFEFGADLILRKTDELDPAIRARRFAPRHGHRVDRPRNGHQYGVGAHGEGPM